ncbi:hypothetical protein O181_105900 [Austropuccinia psidii MF-1]|uniref:Uncharacterized protein n=1 Tax=Austropuccinia psidii MF-1 TaxID=1389203 RepID=A0A9Q3JRD5_9BASI|nr:hypothetical protein [Austropuccinia psidii MF-1]
MVTNSPSANLLLPLPSFINQIITFLWLRSEVTIGWWPRRGGGQINTRWNQDNHPEAFPSSSLRLQNPLPLGNAFIIVDNEGVLMKATWEGTPLAMWLEWSHNKQAFFVCLLASITSVILCGHTNAGDTLLSA